MWVRDPGPGPLEAALAMLHRRGPDRVAAVEWAADPHIVRLGATRLSVQDLSSSADQPMTSVDGRLTIAYNGEITNFIEIRDALLAQGTVFRSRGDTEVLLEAWRAWGPRCLEWLEGMYAFAVLDRQVRRLTLARDPFGIKPLFVSLTPSSARVLFASELPSLLALRGGVHRLDDQAALDYLVSGTYDRGERTFIEGVAHLTPGTLLNVDLAQGACLVSTSDRSWLPAIDTDAAWLGRTAQDAAAAVRERFLVSVHRNLRSDVPVGLALSGGIDSSAIVCAVRAVEPSLELRTFSFVSPGSPGDESTWIDTVNAATGARPTLVSATAGELVADLDDLILAQGEPFGSLSIYAQYRVFQAMHQAGIVVSLDGQGADEALAGYRGYPAARMASLLGEHRPLAAARHAIRWSRLPGASAQAALGYLATAAGFGESVRRVRARMRSGSAVLRPGLIAERGLASPFRSVSPASLPPPASARGGTRLKAALRADLLDGDLAALLRHGDRNSMRFSVEGRVPFLDRGLIEVCLALPEHLLVDAQATTKSIFRWAMRGIVPDPILDRRDKIGFQAPDASWLSSERAHVARLLREGPDIGIVDTRTAADAIEHGHLSPALTWRLANLTRWAALLDVDAS